MNVTQGSVIVLVLAAICGLRVAQAEIKSVAILYRHGQRTPVTDYPSYWSEKTREMGYGQLTEVGSRQLWDMGVLLRARYLSLFPSKGRFRLSNMRVKSSLPERCIQSLSSFMAGFYPPPMLDNNLPIRWQPIPFTVDNEGKILHLKLGVCPKFDTEVMSYLNNAPEEFTAMIEKDKPILDKLSDLLGEPLDNMIAVGMLAEVIRADLFLDTNTPEWAETAFNQTLHKYVEPMFAMILKTETMRKVRGGPMLTEIVDNMLAVKANNGTGVNFIIYSAHDMTVSSLTAVLGVESQIPKVVSYADTVAVELHQTGSGEPEVRVVYFDNENAKPNTINLSVPGCGHPCRLTNFVNAVSKYLVDDLDRVCGN